jgi:hypothetical protein
MIGICLRKVGTFFVSRRSVLLMAQVETRHHDHNGVGYQGSTLIT